MFLISEILLSVITRVNFNIDNNKTRYGEMKKDIVYLLLIICTAILLTEMIGTKREQSIPTFNINAQTEQEIKDEIIIAAFIRDIEKSVQHFYTQNLSKNVIVYDYETSIISAEKLDGGLIQIKFGVVPQEGAHDPVGFDVITYTIDSGGTKQITDYQHIKNFHGNG